MIGLGLRVPALTLTGSRPYDLAMKLHTAALAIAAGWLLLNPPLGDGKAPLNQWTVYHPVSSKSTTFHPRLHASGDGRDPPSAFTA